MEQATQGFTATGLQNGETAGTVTVTYGAGANATDPVGTTLAGVAISALNRRNNQSSFFIRNSWDDLSTPRDSFPTALHAASARA